MPQIIENDFISNSKSLNNKNCNLNNNVFLDPVNEYIDTKLQN